MDKSELKKDFLEFVAYLEKMAIIHAEHCHIVEHKKTGDSCVIYTGKSSEAGSRSSGHNSGGSTYEGGDNKASDRDRTKSVLVLPPGSISRNNYVDDNIYFISVSLPSLFYTMSSHRDIYIYVC
jgi:hypothetical protein